MACRLFVTGWSVTSPESLQELQQVPQPEFLQRQEQPQSLQQERQELK